MQFTDKDLQIAAEFLQNKNTGDHVLNLAKALQAVREELVSTGVSADTFDKSVHQALGCRDMGGMLQPSNREHVESLAWRFGEGKYRAANYG